jgi:hypothetical protein
LGCSFVLAQLVTAHAASKPLPERTEFLERLGRVATLYRDRALGFTCEETIYFRIGDELSSIHRFDYIYRQSETAGGLIDFRTPRGKGRKEGAEDGPRVRLEDLDLPAYLLRSYSWVFVFDEAARPLYDYEVESWEHVGTSRAVRVRFEGKPPFREGINDWIGHAWIDPKTYQILRVRAVKSDEWGQYRVYERVQAGEDLPPDVFEDSRFSSFTTEFRNVKNGMRFPSRVVIERKAIEPRTGFRGELTLKDRTLFQVTQDYNRYRFFGVRTRAEIQEIVNPTE